METDYYGELHHRCLHLWNCYFSSVTLAPVTYQTLGRSLETLAFALENVCMVVTHQTSRACTQYALRRGKQFSTNYYISPGLVDRAVRQSASKVLWLALYRLSALFDEVESFLRRLKITQNRPPQWWFNFAQKARFGYSQTFLDLIQRADFHIWALHTTTRTFNGYIFPSSYSFSLLIVPVSTWVECSKRIVSG